MEDPILVVPCAWCRGGRPIRVVYSESIRGYEHRIFHDDCYQEWNEAGRRERVNKFGEINQKFSEQELKDRTVWE